jgi:hypothetical protein
VDYDPSYLQKTEQYLGALVLLVPLERGTFAMRTGTSELLPWRRARAADTADDATAALGVIPALCHDIAANGQGVLRGVIPALCHDIAANGRGVPCDQAQHL